MAFPAGESYSEYAVAEEKYTFPISDGINFETAAASPIATFTSYNLLCRVGRMKPGESVLIHGAAGGIGTTAVQIPRLA